MNHLIGRASIAAATLLALFSVPGAAYGYPGGITGRTLKGPNNGCSCHGSQSASIAVLIKAPSTLVANQAAQCTVTVAGTATGVDIASSAGNLAPVSANLHLSNSELTQNSAQNPGRFIFTYTAPATTGSQTLYAVGVESYPGNWNHAANHQITITAATPPAPVLLSPPNGATNQPTTVTLSWNASGGATSYRVQVSTTSLFTTTIFDDSTIATTSTQVASLNNSTRYFWRVRAKNGAGSGPYTAAWDFTTIGQAPVAPVLLLPPDGSTSQPTTLTLRWFAASGTTSYRVQLATDSLFLSGFFLDDSAVVDTFRTTSALSGNTTLYWRVRGRNGSGTGVWSSRWSFSTIDLITNTYPYLDAWNVVSVPLTVGDLRKSVVFPSAVSSAFAFDPDAGYAPKDTLQNGVGYWLKFNGAQNVSFTGTVRAEDSVGVSQGWNLIGTITNPVAVVDIVQVPTGIVQSSFYGYSGSYTPADTLHPARAYWVKVNQPGKLLLH